MDQAILQSFIHMFLEWDKVHLSYSLLSLFEFIDWLGCKWGEGVVFCLSLPFFGHVYIMYTFVCFFGAFNTIAFTYQKKNFFFFFYK